MRSACKIHCSNYAFLFDDLVDTGCEIHSQFATPMFWSAMSQVAQEDFAMFEDEGIV